LTKPLGDCIIGTMKDMKENYKVYWMADIDLPEVMFEGTLAECRAFIAADRTKNGRNTSCLFYAIAK
jgi:hypothetical protein